MRLLVVAAAALINGDGAVLLAQRPQGKSLAGLWEFPGGKIESGENPEAALCRELAEELDLDVDAKDLKPLTFASHAYPEFHLLMPLWTAQRWLGEPKGQEGQNLVWVQPRDLESYPMPEADIPLVSILREHLEQRRLS